MECIVNVVTKSGIRHMLPTPVFLGFPWGLASKESTCNVGDLGSIPGLGRSPGEGKGYPLQYPGLCGRTDWEKGQTTHSSILGLPLWLSW